MEVNSLITNEHFKKGSIKKNKNTSDKIIYEDDPIFISIIDYLKENDI